VATDREQLNGILLPEQLIHPEFKNPSGSGSRNWVVPEEIVEVLHLGNLNFEMLVPEKLEYAW